MTAERLTFPLRISSGVSIPNAEALARCIQTNAARANGKGAMSEAARHLLRQIEAAKQSNFLNGGA